MATSIEDFKLASIAAGFTVGFSVLCIWNAVQQTRALRRPLKSVFIFMVWGEVVANLAIGVVGWLFLDEILKPTVPVLFSLLFFWVFEVQLLMQIIINRITVVLDNHRLANMLKWGTAFIITLINIAVFIIWIPAHLEPPPIPLFVTINKYWDRTSKVLILLVDASLNYFFLRTVKLRLVNYHGLAKYSALVRFNARLMILSISMDLMLILLMFLHNQVVYIQFHPVAYMVKLNIELTMASLITQIAKSTVEARNNELGVRFTTRSRSGSNASDASNFCLGCGSTTTLVPYPPFQMTPAQSRYDERCLSPTLIKGVRIASETSTRPKEAEVRIENLKEWGKERRERRKGSFGDIQWDKATRMILKEEIVPPTPKLFSKGDAE